MDFLKRILKNYLLQSKPKYLFLLLFFTTFLSKAQIAVDAKLDSSTASIGDHVKLTLQVSFQNKKDKIQIAWPVINDSISKNVEVVSQSKLDTIKEAGNENAIKINKYITLIAFEPGNYTFQGFPFAFKIGQDTSVQHIQTGSVTLQIRNIAIDTTKEIKDIKLPQQVPFTWQEALPYVVGGLILVVLATIIYFVFKRYKRKKDGDTTPVIKRPAHELAMEALAQIEQQKIWQQGNYKEYHSRIADTIRFYIENKFAINALEMPTISTLQTLKENKLSKAILQKLTFILESADLVKFAKNQPLASENEQSLQFARDFVIETSKSIETNTAKEGINN